MPKVYHLSIFEFSQTLNSTYFSENWQFSWDFFRGKTIGRVINILYFKIKILYYNASTQFCIIYLIAEKRNRFFRVYSTPPQPTGDIQFNDTMYVCVPWYCSWAASSRVIGNRAKSIKQIDTNRGGDVAR